LILEVRRRGKSRNDSRPHFHPNQIPTGRRLKLLMHNN
jgi:hypothetical protein